VELRNYCLILLEEELDAEARAEVAKLGGNPMLEDVLNELLEWKWWTDENKPVQ
jgi:geranylgeranyl diphosphate synthase type 3